MRAPTLAYGDESLKVPAPFDEAQVLDAPDLPPAADPEATWRAACAAAALRVAATLPPGARLALVVPDRTRPLPLPRLLPPLLDALAAEKIEARRITIVPASGIHAPMSRADLADANAQPPGQYPPTVQPQPPRGAIFGAAAARFGDRAVHASSFSASARSS